MKKIMLFSELCSPVLMLYDISRPEIAVPLPLSQHDNIIKLWCGYEVIVP